MKPRIAQFAESETVRRVASRTQEAMRAITKYAREHDRAGRALRRLRRHGREHERKLRPLYGSSRIPAGVAKVKVYCKHCGKYSGTVEQDRDDTIIVLSRGHRGMWPLRLPECSSHGPLALRSDILLPKLEQATRRTVTMRVPPV